MPASHDLTPAHCPFRFRRPVSPFSNFGHQVADGVTVTGVQITSRIVTRVGADTRVSVTSRSRNHARGKQKVVENKPRRTSTYWFFFSTRIKKTFLSNGRKRVLGEMGRSGHHSCLWSIVSCTLSLHIFKTNSRRLSLFFENFASLYINTSMSSFIQNKNNWWWWWYFLLNNVVGMVGQCHQNDIGD